MVKAVIINGSNQKTSRLTGIHQYVEHFFTKADIKASSIYVHELPAQDLIHTNFTSEEIQQANQFVEEADIIVILTPIYKASYSGILKTYLDLIPQKGFENKVVLPIAIGGSSAHLLALEYALKPVISVLGATEILKSVYVLDKQVERLENGDFKISDEAVERIDEQLQAITSQLVQQPVL